MAEVTYGPKDTQIIDVNGELPDAQFTKRKDAEKYVSYFKEHHTYRIVKAQHWANHDE